MFHYGAGYLLDLILGDPVFLYHPVRIIGKFIELFEKSHFKDFYRRNEFIDKFMGVLLLFCTTAFTYSVTLGVIEIAGSIGQFFENFITVWIAYQVFATRCLMDEGRRIYKVLKKQDLELARKEIGYLVSRDTKDLSLDDILKAALETLSENITDGVIAPMFYMFIGGVPLAMAYKAVNTLDSMVGYRNEKYENFGKASAIFDDVLNFIPARLASMLIVIATLFIKGTNTKKSLSIFLRDRRNHASPNSACTESAIAGALSISLGGPTVYFGKLKDKPYIGDGLIDRDISMINTVNKVILTVSLLGMVLGCSVLLLLETVI